MPPTYRIGTSGWSYKHWSGDFYPEGLPSGNWLEHYAQQFDTVEVNASFYRLPQAKTVQNWGRRVPDGFTYTFKVSRYITHIQRLRDSTEALQTFHERIEQVGAGHLGAFLYQVPPGLHKDLGLLEGFLALLPQGRQHVFEFRDPSWYDDEVIALLRRHEAGFCVHDMRDLESPIAVTGPTAYFRFHGPGQAYSSNYSDDQLSEWAGRIRSVAEETEVVYAYFNNDIGGHAVRNALALRGMLAG